MAIKDTKTLGTILKDLVQQSNAHSRRLRMLEDRAGVMMTRTEAVEDAHHLQQKKGEQLAAEAAGRMKQLEGRVAELEKGMQEMVNEVKKLPTGTQVRELENLIQIFNPLKSQFVTREEIDVLLAEKLRRRI